MNAKRILLAETGALFFIGSLLYPILELTVRGYTHFSMGVLGGICLVAIRWVDRVLGRVRTVWKAAASAVIITQLEWICGLLVNRLWNLRVWDYSRRAWNLEGQICPLFSFFWFLLSFGAILAFHRIERLYRKHAASAR